MVIIVVNVRKTSESEVSVLLRILTNYLQIISTTMSFSTSYPDTLTDSLVPAQRIGESSESFLSFDCFITDYEIKGPFPSNSFFKMFLSIWLPLMLFLVVALIWLIVWAVKRKWVVSIRRYLVISFISIVFLLHPKLAQQGFSVFRCIEIDTDLNKVRIDTEIECYSLEHLKWSFALGLPILIFWVIGLPLFALWLMYRSFKDIDIENRTRRYFLILYQGLKEDKFYWEFVNSLRKVLILLAFLLPDDYKIMFSSLVLLITWRVQHNLQPYKLDENNRLEILGVIAGVITLC